MNNAKINSLRAEYSELIEFCRSNNQISFEMYINNTYKKSLLLAAASYFETVIIEAIYDLVNEKTHSHPEIVAFVNNKALTRQYYKFFSWKDKNTNQFLS